MNKKFLQLIVLGIFVVSLTYFVIALHTVSPAGFYVLEDNSSSSFFNITVDYTVNTGNITQVNITLPGSFSYVTNSNGTNGTKFAFSTSGNVLTWSNFTNFILNGTQNSTSFWFNATAATPGNYNITVTSTNLTSTNSTNIPVTVNDTTVPSEVNLTPTTGSNHSGTFLLNVSIAENGVIQRVFFNITNSTGVQNVTYTASNFGNGYNYTLNTSSFLDGVYNISVYVNDTYGNLNNTVISSSIIFDNTAPNIESFSCDDTSVSAGATITCSCSGNDTLSNVSSASFTTNPSTSSLGTFSTSCTITDNAGNTNSSSLDYTVSSATSPSNGGGAGTVWADLYIYSDKELSEKGSLVRNFQENYRVKLKISNQTHYVGVTNLTSSTATIEITSDPQTAILSIGDARKIEVTNDSYYDLLITLNGIVSSQANLTIEYINELMTPETVAQEVAQETAAQGELDAEVAEGETSSIGSTILWIVAIIVILAIAIVGFIILKKKGLIPGTMDSLRREPRL